MNGLFDEVVKIANLSYDWNKLNNKTIVISGGTGFIGSFLIDVLTYRNEKFEQKIKIISLSRSALTNTKFVEYKTQDIREKIDINENVDYVVHLASNTHPAQYSADPVGTITTNFYGCDNLLKLAVEKNARFVFASSVEIYGNSVDEKPMDEEYCGYINCNNARAGYNESKRVCESLIQSYREQYNVDAVIARFSRVFGPDKKKDSKAMAQFIDNAINGEDIILKSKGEQRFSYCYIADAVSGLIKIMLDGINGEAYNVAEEDDGMTLGDYAKFLGSLAGTNVVFDIEKNSYVSKASYAIIDISKLKKLGWSPLYSAKEGLFKAFKIKKNRTN